MGSNQGDSLGALDAALSELSASIAGLRASSVYRTKPRYDEDQAEFLNLVAAGDTELTPRELLALTQGIEAAHGRDRSKERFKGPRPLDIDLLLYGEFVMAEPELLIPHPGIEERAFVLVPLLELEPELRAPAAAPRGGRRYADALALLPDQGIYLFRPARL